MLIRKLKSLIKFVLRKEGNKQVPSTLENKFTNIKPSSITPSFVVDVRDKSSDKKYLKVGDNSIVNGYFCFENANGSVVIGNNTFVGGGKIVSINDITIGNDVLISWGCTIMDNDAHSLVFSERKDDVRDWKRGIEEGKVGGYKNWNNVKSAPINIKDKSWIGFDVVILKGVTIGEGAIVGSRSVVTKNVPDWTIVGGNPAKVIREIPLSER